MRQSNASASHWTIWASRLIVPYGAALVLIIGLRWPMSGLAQSGPVLLPNPVLFVTQVPVPADFTTIGSVFGNHLSSLSSVARGGDLWIRYGDGTLKNLTQAAGYGTSGMQGATAIAVREPSVHWSGTKALFSMVVGAPTQQYQVQQYYWQIYEITGLGPTDTPVDHACRESAIELQQRQPHLRRQRSGDLHVRSPA